MTIHPQVKGARGTMILAGSKTVLRFDAEGAPRAPGTLHPYPEVPGCCTPT